MAQVGDTSFFDGDGLFEIGDLGLERVVCAMGRETDEGVSLVASCLSISASETG